MKKITLDLDTLLVESFSTSSEAADRRRGTVRGLSGPATRLDNTQCCTTLPGGGDDTGGYTAETCKRQVTCDYTGCDTTCAGW